jgi:CheY-like chemotaxis protein
MFRGLPLGRRIASPVVGERRTAPHDIKCKAAGMDDHLTKPLDRQRLQSRLEHFLGVEEDAATG